ncbi:MAG TPA: hypothetical protein VFN35_23175 [Ktedonobacteraceae bacterium]|nr:hypothetical protein [Ktedonobacteraceae bacterium]
MSQYIKDPLEETQQPASKSGRPAYGRASSVSVFVLLAIVCLALVLFSTQILANLISLKTAQGNSTSQVDVTLNASSVAQSSPFFRPDGKVVSPLKLPGNPTLLWQNRDGIFQLSTSQQAVQTIATPGYTYNEAVTPLLTPSGQLLYSGEEGIWLLSTLKQPAVPTRLAHFDPNMMITSLALSQDGKMVAWITRPASGGGQTKIYAGSLEAPGLIWQQSTVDCPCYRIFSFLPGKDTTLLLTNDQGSNQITQYGLWSLDITHPAGEPHQIMDGNSQKGPLMLSPSGSTLLYSPYEGVVSPPADNGVPQEIATLSYANSLSLAALHGSLPTLGNSQTLLPEQHNLLDNALYHWVTTPTFSPDSSTLAYVEFSSDSQPPYSRHSALYLVKISGSGEQTQTEQPSLFMTTTSKLLELGPWLNNHVMTLYGDGYIYAMDIQSGASTILAQPGRYTHILGIIGAR